MSHDVLEKLFTKIEEVYENFRAREYEFSKQQTSTCFKGCGACCHFPIISCTAGEAFVLYHILRNASSEVEVLHSHLRSYAEKYFSHSSIEGGLPFTQTQQNKAFVELKLPCPLFQSTGEALAGHCGIFGSRPLICGYFHSLDNPSLCREKKPHRTLSPVIAAGEEAIDTLQTYERLLIGRSTLGHLPLLLAAMTYEEGRSAFLKSDFYNAETNTLPPEEAQWSYDFDLYIELMAAAGYQITQNDIHSILQAQEELKR